MKPLLIVLLLSNPFLTASAQAKEEKVPASKKEVLVVDASCGQCKFSLSGKGCNLAIRIKGDVYFVDGSAIDDHGDAHAKDGFCNAIRKAKVQGEVVDNRFKATYFKLIEESDNKQPEGK